MAIAGFVSIDFAETIAVALELPERFYSRIARYGTGRFLKGRLEALKPPGA